MEQESQGTSSTPVTRVDEVADQRRERRKLRRTKRQEENLKKKVEEIRKPRNQKISLITADTYNKLKVDCPAEKGVFNKRLKSAQTQFALTDFIVNKEKPKAKKVSGTTVPKLRKGKVREIPKRRNLSKLKKAIIDIRNKRKREAEGEETTEKDNSEREAKEEQELEAIPEPDQSLQSPPQDLDLSGLITYSRRFRSYCDHENNPEIAGVAENILQDLFRFQDRAYEKNQIKARAHRRYVVGFKESMRSLEVNKVKLLLIATDLEPSPGEGGLDEAVEKLKEICKEKSIPYCFPLQRRKIGYLLYKKAPISCVGVLDISGSEENFKKCLQHLKKNRISLVKRMESLKIK